MENIRIEGNHVQFSRRNFIKAAGAAAGAVGILGQNAIAADEKTAEYKGPRKKIKITFIGGGSQTWAPNIIRDITFKPGMERLDIDIHLLEIHWGRAQAIHNLFQAKFKEWGIDRVRTHPTLDPVEGLKDADFVIIAISTGRLPAMSYDLAIPDNYSIYQTVGDTCGPGGWARTLRNLPIFLDYARKIKRLAPNAYVLNYTNPLACLTKVLADELGPERVVGLCHGLFECYGEFMRIFGLKREDQIQVRSGGVNHFFWILDFKIDGKDGYKLLEERLKGKRLAEIMQVHGDTLGFVSNRWVTTELFDNYGIMPYIGDRHTSEFFGCYITSQGMIDRFKLVRTTIAHREKMYENAAANIEKWTREQGGLDKNPSRETAADMMCAIVFNEPYTDVVNLVNQGQISNLPDGAVVETLGQVSSRGFTPLTVGPLPERVRATVLPHCDVQLRTVEAGIAGDLDAALLALAVDPVCAHLPVSDVKKMGMELLQANKKFVKDFFQI
ncbi:MAG: twin-arginine translocation signal domain-containing protein [Armatimonadetes bacterium]|nr:twin-arginine translocation signal domain-containing protein [Armatimonadota bacterium]